LHYGRVETPDHNYLYLLKLRVDRKHICALPISSTITKPRRVYPQSLKLM
jgi:hypothetical protein